MSEIASIELTCGGAPLQFEGRLDDGRWFYFRSRGEGCWLGVGDSLDAAIDDSENLEIGLTRWESNRYAFSYMPEEVGRVLIPWMLTMRGGE